MRKKGVTKKVKLHEKDVEEPLWRSPRVRRYLLFALAAAVLLIVGGFAAKSLLSDGALSANAGATMIPRADSASGRASILETTGDDYAAKEQWYLASSAYLNALDLLNYNSSFSDVNRIFGKYCLSRKNLSLLEDGICRVTNPRDRRVLVKRVR